MKQHFDFIIVGQGLAGTILAHDLEEKGNRLLLIDSNESASASRVAAGLINPVGMKRCIPSWGAEVFYPYAIRRYQDLEAKMNASFLAQRSIFKLFGNEEDAHQWKIKYSNQGMNQYINAFLKPSSFPYLKDNFGGAMLDSVASLDTKVFLDSSRKHFEKRHLCLDQRFDYDLIDLKRSSYKDYTFNRIIFAEGYFVKDNPYFNALPLSPTKGEVMTIKIPSHQKFNHCISKGIYIIPLGNHLYRVGSTYHHKDFNDLVTDEGKQHIHRQLKSIFKTEYIEVQTDAGVRPTVRDRKPLLGLHPFNPKFGVFNGLGTRGALQGPLLSGEFCSFLTNSTVKTQIADFQRITRFLKP